MTFLAKEGTRVLPGDVAQPSALQHSASGEVDLTKSTRFSVSWLCPSPSGTPLRDATTEPIVLRRIVSARGQVHWVSGTMVSVASTKQASLTTDATESSEEQQQSASASTTAAAAASQWRSDAFGPLVGDTGLFGSAESPRLRDGRYRRRTRKCGPPPSRGPNTASVVSSGLKTFALFGRPKTSSRRTLWTPACDQVTSSLRWCCPSPMPNSTNCPPLSRSWGSSSPR